MWGQLQMAEVAMPPPPDHFAVGSSDSASAGDDMQQCCQLHAVAEVGGAALPTTHAGVSISSPSVVGLVGTVMTSTNTTDASIGERDTGMERRMPHCERRVPDVWDCCGIGVGLGAMICVARLLDQWSVCMLAAARTAHRAPHAPRQDKSEVVRMPAANAVSQRGHAAERLL